MDPRWTARTENLLAEALCMASDGSGRGSVCGTHLRQARAALAHLADRGVLKEPEKEGA